MAELTPELLRERLAYDKDTGKLFWRERSLAGLSGRKLGQANAFNLKRANREAFVSKGGDGYFKASVYGNSISAHRAAWAIYYGEWPEAEIDHINGIKADNRIENLRAVSHAENSKNLAIRSDNTFGYPGVRPGRRAGMWRAGITVHGRYIGLGQYDGKARAIEARKEAEARFGFHENHGRRS